MEKSAFVTERQIVWSRRYGCHVGTEMASAVGEDRGWGMSEAVPSQLRGATGLGPIHKYI